MSECNYTAHSLSLLSDSETEFQTWLTIQSPATQEHERILLRTSLFLHYHWIAASISSRYCHRRMPYASLQDHDDICGWADLGLWESTDRYDPFCGTSFRTFATYRVKGAIIDGLRLMQNFTRDVSRIRRELEPLMEALAHELDRMPTLEELAARHPGKYIGREFLLEDVINDPLLSASVFNQVHEKVDAGYQAQFGTEIELALQKHRHASADLTPFERLQRTDLISKVLEILRDGGDDQLESSVIYMYYFSNMNSRRIASTLGISITLVSEKKNTGLMKIRKAVRADDELAEQLRSYCA